MPPTLRQGLLGSTAITPPAVAAQQQAGLAAPPAPPAEEQPNVTEDEQAEYDLLVDNAYNILYEDMPTLLKGISGGGDPVTGLANTVGSIPSTAAVASDR